jgi:hypothetical protein
MIGLDSLKLTNSRNDTQMSKKTSIAEMECSEWSEFCSE